MKSILLAILLGTLLAATTLPGRADTKLDKKTQEFVTQLRRVVKNNPVGSHEIDKLSISPDFRRALVQAAKAGDDALVVELLNIYSGDTRNEHSADSPLISAVHYNDSAVVHALLSRPQNFNARDDFGQTALHVASHEYHFDNARLLLDKGMDIEARTKSGDTPLLLAAYNRHSPTLQLLLERGAKVNAVNDTDQSALMHAAASGNLQSVMLLLSRGANVRLKDKNDKTALDLAAPMPLYDLSDTSLIPSPDEPARKQKFEADFKAIKRLLTEAMGNQ